MATKSERLYDDYCRLRGYPCDPVSAGSAKSPDRLVTTPAGGVVVEIKELTPNEDDERQLRELRERGSTHGGGTPGARVYEKIRAAAPQLKAKAKSGAPSILVLYNNIAAGEWRVGSHHLDGSAIDFGMYGLQTALLQRSPDEGRWVNVGPGRGERRQMSEDARIYISAVQVLWESPGEVSEPLVFTYHNYFAVVPLSAELFRGPLDRHFRKPAHPDGSPQIWEEVVALSGQGHR